MCVYVGVMCVCARVQYQIHSISSGSCTGQQPHLFVKNSYAADADASAGSIEVSMPCGFRSVFSSLSLFCNRGCLKSEGTRSLNQSVHHPSVLTYLRIVVRNLIQGRRNKRKQTKKKRRRCCLDNKLKKHTSLPLTCCSVSPWSSIIGTSLCRYSNPFPTTLQ